MTYENIYGLGYERATEEGPGVEYKNQNSIWQKRFHSEKKLEPALLYRRPIKLQVGHRYVRSDGVVLKIISIDKTKLESGVYLGSDGRTRGIDGKYWIKSEAHVFDIVTHIEEPETKEEPMKDTVTVNGIALTHAQVEAAHAEMVRQKAENEPSIGKVVKAKESKTVFIIDEISLDNLRFRGSGVSNFYPPTSLEVVQGTPDQLSWLRGVLEGK